MASGAPGTEGPRGFFRAIFDPALSSIKKMQGKIGGIKATAPPTQAPTPSAAKPIKATRNINFPGAKILGKIFERTKEASNKEAGTMKSPSEKAVSSTFSGPKQKVIADLKGLLSEGGYIFDSRVRNEGRFSKIENAEDKFTFEIAEDIKDPSAVIKNKFQVKITDSGKIRVDGDKGSYIFNSVDEMAKVLLQNDKKELTKASKNRVKDEAASMIKERITMEKLR